MATRTGLAVIVNTALGGVQGCSDEAGPATAVNETAQIAATPTTTRRGAIDLALYAGQMKFRIEYAVPLRGQDVPFVVYAGLEEETPTRMKLNAFADLRSFQARAPGLASAPLVVSCTQTITLDLQELLADGDSFRFRGQVDAAFSLCRGRGSP
ncbi:MAG: hypothetical protein HRU31_11705 [Rhodobacteraceae bacterium]|nr:hypothetical protein [Paracoccaceae bacterium]